MAKSSEDRLDLREAERILHDDHYGLDQVKERILDFLAVRKLRQSSNEAPVAQILCLVGPPGVGKTSLGRSIAPLNGPRICPCQPWRGPRRSRIRGHRRTYIGAMPGRMITAMKQAGTINPVILLDEIDKLSSDYRGDPASALLEVLDPEQNKHFIDHFLDLAYDLSQCSLSPRPTTWAKSRDRFAIGWKSSRSAAIPKDEKTEIGRRYLLAREMAAQRPPCRSRSISLHKLWIDIVREYTREAGVRELDTRSSPPYAASCARDRARQDRTRSSSKAYVWNEFLGPSVWPGSDPAREDQVGLAIGLGTPRSAAS